MGRQANKSRRCEGQAIYEGLLCIMVLLLLLVGTFEFSRIFILGQRLVASSRTNAMVSSRAIDDDTKATFFQQTMFYDMTGESTVSNTVRAETMPPGTYDPSGYFKTTMAQLMVGHDSQVAFAYRPMPFLRNAIGDPHVQSARAYVTTDCLTSGRVAFFQEHLPKVLTSLEAASREWILSEVEGVPE